MTFTLTRGPDGVVLGRFAHLPVAHGVAGRTGGVSTGRYASLNLGPRSGDQLTAVATNRNRFLAAAGIGGLRVIAPRQVHSADVAVHRRGDALPPSGVFDGDGLVTDDSEVALMVLAADCAAVLLHDPVRSVVAAVHAGWRGTAGGMAAAGVRAMVEAFGCRPGDLRAGIGPAIGRCCYEVGADVARAVGAATPGGVEAIATWQPDGKARIDIATASAAQLLAAGLDPALVAVAGVCTACHTDLFYSHRREGESTGRFGAAISLAVASPT